ncbi:MAG: hypothetical protein NXI11_14015 [Proteobacteria bacterium]|nr:hypothetical protein [Pseudomonadota bacterium]
MSFGGRIRGRRAMARRDRAVPQPLKLLLHPSDCLRCDAVDALGFPMKAVADTLGVSRSNLHERVSGKTKPRRRCHKAQDAALLTLIERLEQAR